MIFKKIEKQGTLVAQLVKYLISAQVIVLRMVDLNLHQALLSAQSLLEILCCPLSQLVHALPLSLSLRKINKHLKNKEKELSKNATDIISTRKKLETI